MEQKQCIFCAIANRQIPAKIIYEDENFVAFLDINPLSPGHTLVITKHHYENVFDMPADVAEKLMKVVKAITANMKEKIGAQGVNLMNASGKAAEQTIPHFHLHIVPRNEGDGLNLNEWWGKNMKKIDEKTMDELVKILKTESVEEVKETEEKEEEVEKPIEHTEEEAYWIRRELELG